MKRFQVERVANEGCLAAGVALLFPGVAVSVIAVAFPEAEALLIEQHEAANPLDAFPGIKVGHHQA
jgi:hypothetical protein